jgi:hypothetical protein
MKIKEKGESMKTISVISKTIPICAVLCLILLASTVVQATTVTYNGTISASTLGSSLSTDLAEFDSSLGTLTGVQIGLSLTVTPYAMVANFGSTPQTFTSSDWITYGFSPANIWTISHSSDSWTLAAPTVSTGTIYGSGQVIQPFNILTLVGSNSANANFAESALPAYLAEYVGTGTLSFGTAGMGQVLISDGSLYGGGGGNLAGTCSVTYEYTPEPATLLILGFGGLALLRKRRK